VAALVIAHRTCPRDAAENSIAGIREAAKAKADVVEIDVRLTSDGHPVLMHDPSLWRMTRRAGRIDRTGLRRSGVVLERR
jgi:glycerophosphoryl diester phosphodiesterase